MSTIIAGALAWLGAFALYLHGAGPGISLEDSAELAVCVATLSNAHAPGFPWYVLPGKLASLVPLGSPLFRLELMSAVAGALAVVAVFLLALGMSVRAGFTRAQALAGALASAAMLATSMTLWWESSIAEKYPVFLALFGWSAYAIYRFEETQSARWFTSAFFLSGLAFGYHFQGIYLAVPLIWLLVRSGSARSRAMAAFIWCLPVVTRFLYTPLRASTGPAVNWGVPDIISRFIDYSAFRIYQSDRFLVSGAGFSPSLAEAPMRFLAHTFLVPFEEISWAFILSIAGFAVAWKWNRRVATGILAVAGLNLAVTVNYRTSHLALYDLPYIWLLCALAGLGAAQLASKWRPALGLAPVVFLSGFFLHRDFSMRDTDYLARDHMQNLMASASGNGIIVSGSDPWLFLPWYAREVAPRSGIQGLFVGALEWNSPERKTLAKILGSRARQLDYSQEGSAIFRALARASSPRPVYADYFSILLPSTGLRWRGILLEIPPVPAAETFDQRSADLARKMRLRGMFHLRGGEEKVARWYGTGFNTQGRAALASGMKETALDLARRGLRIAPGLPELHDLAGRALFSLGRFREAEDAWRRALEAASRGNQAWFEPYLGLAGLKPAGERDSRLDRLENLKSAVLAGLGPNNHYVLAADRLRKEARFDEAEKTCRRAIAEIYDTIGGRYMGEMKLPQAYRSWVESLAWDPGHVQSLYSLGQVAMLEERFADAADLFRKCLVHAAPDARLGIEPMLARAMANARSIENLPALEAKLESADAGPELLCDAGNIYWRLGRTLVAESLYRRALAKAPRYARAWSNLGSALVEQGRQPEAVRAYEKALDIDPGYSEPMLNLASVLAGTGKTAEALDWIERALESRPGWPEAVAMRDTLKQAGGAGK